MCRPQLARSKTYHPRHSPTPCSGRGMECGACCERHKSCTGLPGAGAGCILGLCRPVRPSVSGLPDAPFSLLRTHLNWSQPVLSCRCAAPAHAAPCVTLARAAHCAAPTARNFPCTHRSRLAPTCRAGKATALRLPASWRPGPTTALEWQGWPIRRALGRPCLPWNGFPAAPSCLEWVSGCACLERVSVWACLPLIETWACLPLFETGIHRGRRPLPDLHAANVRSAAFHGFGRFVSHLKPSLRLGPLHRPAGPADGLPHLQ